MFFKYIFGAALGIIAAERVAIIGSGVTGAATAWYYNQATNGSAEIVVFEKREKVGGRFFHETFHNQNINGGANIIITQNTFAMELLNIVGLKRKNLNYTKGKMMVWDGEKTRFIEGNNIFEDVWRAWWRGYPLLSNPIKKDALKRLKHWERLSASLNRGEFFQNPMEVCQALEIGEWMGKSGLEWLIQVLGASNSQDVLDNPYVDDILGGIQWSNYNQRLNETGAIVTITSAMTSAVEQSDIFIPQKTSLFSPRLLAAAGAKTKLNTKVTRVEKRESQSGYHLLYENSGGKLGEEFFDRVFIATPLYAAEGLEFDVPGIQSLDKEKKLRMKSIWTTFVFGRLKGKYFGLSQWQADDIRGIFVPSSANNFFNSIGLQWKLSGELPGIYKIFSHKEVSGDEISKIFLSGYELLANWQIEAYPLYNLGETSATNTAFELAENLYYPSAMESLASAVEMSALSARNIVNLAVKDKASDNNGVHHSEL